MGKIKTGKRNRRRSLGINNKTHTDFREEIGVCFYAIDSTNFEKKQVYAIDSTNFYKYIILCYRNKKIREKFPRNTYLPHQAQHHQNEATPCLDRVVFLQTFIKYKKEYQCKQNSHDVIVSFRGRLNTSLFCKINFLNFIIYFKRFM